MQANPNKDHKDTIIKVIGVGGGGCNAVNHMFKLGIVGVNYVVCNTDSQALDQSPIPIRVQLGPGLTEGRGAGSQPEVGKNATIESMDEIKRNLAGGTRMVFITAGMGGGTGTGGAPMVAKAARELGILTVGIVSSPFIFEGRKRVIQAQEGIEEMKKNVDTLIVISNDKLREIHGNLSLSNAFARADDIIATAAKGIAEIITVPGYVNVDFEDVNTVMKNSGVAIMGIGIADGEERSLKAVKMALSSPLLNDNDIHGARHILLNITSGTKEVLMDEVGDIISYIQESAGYTSEVIWGNCVDESLGERISVTVIATGFEIKNDGFQKQERFFEEAQKRNPQDNIRKQNPVVNNTQQNTNQTPPPPPNKQTRVVFNLDDDTDTTRNHTPQNQDRRQETNNFRSNNYEDSQNQQILEERRRRLRGLSMKLSGSDLNELEKEPAYKRRNMNLEDVPHSSETNVSKYSLYEEDSKKSAEIKQKRNPFLHDNVD
ncbi:MAG: cell division protein FtsZ [Chitinophagales bacterium]|jgi:cell division protein FtsZ|nr:cell division protein FtsZ [Chitinophagales bacterium]HNI43544.1 cell division protein FtsZ [Chitinophagales bacterium]